ncbi:hypothetical protein LA6_001150 [Marinibacterium anthonyi]|nr:hypothetical protein LA6_001150 [Marinibacterium anthonyi]
MKKFRRLSMTSAVIFVSRQCQVVGAGTIQSWCARGSTKRKAWSARQRASASVRQPWLKEGGLALVRHRLPKGVHRVRRRVKGGVKYHFYAWRGGPKFWEDVTPYPVLPEFFQAFAACTAQQKSNANLIDGLVTDFLSSDAMPPKARSREDVELWIKRFQVEFGEDPIAMFEEPASRAELNSWRKRWIHSPKQYDMAGTHVVKLLNWAVSEGRLKEHHCKLLKKLYVANRSEIVWTPADIKAL